MTLCVNVCLYLAMEVRNLCALSLRKSNIIGGKKSIFYMLLSSDDVVTIQQQTLKYKEHKNVYLWIGFGSVRVGQMRWWSRS